MNKYVFFLILLSNFYLLPAQTINKIETFGFLTLSPLEALYFSCFTPSEYKSVPFNAENPIISGNDTFKIPHLSFFPAIYDTMGWDTALVFEKYVYYRLKVEAGKDTSETHFWENDKEIWISAPVFKTVWKWQNSIEPYWRWEKATTEDRDIGCISANPDDCFLLRLKEKTPRIQFSAKELIMPALIRIQEGVKDTSFALFPPSPYLEMQTIPAQYLCIPKLQKKQVARIDTTWKITILAKEYQTDSTHKAILVRKAKFTELSPAICSYPKRNLKVETIQKLLKKHGFYQGEITDILDDKTKAALSHFQKAHDLPMGKLDINTMEELGIDIDEE